MRLTCLNPVQIECFRAEVELFVKALLRAFDCLFVSIMQWGLILFLMSEVLGRRSRGGRPREQLENLLLSFSFGIFVQNAFPERVAQEFGEQMWTKSVFG